MVSDGFRWLAESGAAQKKKWRGFRKRHGSEGFGQIVQSGAASDDLQKAVQPQTVPENGAALESGAATDGL